MKKYLIGAIAALSFFIFPNVSKAQYYQIASQFRDLISPALSGSFNYKGYVEASYVAGVGNVSSDFVGLSTSQGFLYKSWFFMGAGLGVDYAMAHTQSDAYSPLGRGVTNRAVMVPVFTDFRFNIGNQSKTTLYIDIKLGGSFLMGNKYLAVGDGYLTNRQYFYLKPSIGIKIPLGNNGKSGLNIGATYQMLTSNYSYSFNYYSNPTLSSIGGTVGFEW